ncbi:MAG: hypothetical protein Q8941_04550 [Bacteroidota bacterium]|nr:hypothetical protein [Bacteroidota bacterium]
MNRPLLCFLLLIMAYTVSAQKESFDMLSFSPPKDWKKSTNGNNVSYSRFDEQKESFCIIAVYKSVTSSNNVQTDFTNQWNEIAVKQMSITAQPEIKPAVEEKGWKAMAGTASFQYQGNNAVGILTVLSGKNKTVSILSLTNSQDYVPDIQKFLETVDENKQVQTDPVIAGTNNNGISTATTHFDDGWSATPQDDYILLTKDNFKVCLFYDEKFNDESRKNTVDYYFQHQFAKYYTLTRTVARSDDWHYYIEGEATENATGTRCYVAMDIVAQNGTARTVVAVSPSQAEHQKQFRDNLKNLLGHNRFGVTAQDLTGAWAAGSGSSISYYDYYTNQAVGASAVVMSDKFIFSSGSGFEAEFKGATGMVGNMKTYQQHYKGTFSVLSPWQISTTDQDNKTVVYDCWFEAVKNGVVLHLINHQYTGTTFDLVRAK